MIVKLLTEHRLEFLSLIGRCRGSSESTHVKMPHCWKSHAIAQIFKLHDSISYQNICSWCLEDTYYLDGQKLTTRKGITWTFISETTRNGVTWAFISVTTRKGVTWTFISETTR